MEVINFLYVNDVKIYKFNAKKIRILNHTHFA